MLKSSFALEYNIRQRTRGRNEGLLDFYGHDCYVDKMTILELLLGRIMKYTRCCPTFQIGEL